MANFEDAIETVLEGDTMKGFIVINRYNGALGVGEDRVLWAGNYDNPVTIFPTRRKAQNAIARTVRYAESFGYTTGWKDPWGGQEIIPVKGVKMTTYEYIRLDLDMGDLSELNSLSSVGWKVVAILPRNDGEGYVLLERPIGE